MRFSPSDTRGAFVSRAAARSCGRSGRARTGRHRRAESRHRTHNHPDSSRTHPDGTEPFPVLGASTPLCQQRSEGQSSCHIPDQPALQVSGTKIVGAVRAGASRTDGAQPAGGLLRNRGDLSAVADAATSATYSRLSANTGSTLDARLMGQ